MEAYCAPDRDTRAAGCPDSYVASHYITRPLLVDGRKTDLRVCNFALPLKSEFRRCASDCDASVDFDGFLVVTDVLVTSFQPLRAYIYREGLCRFALCPYSEDPALIADPSIHLTNYELVSHPHLILTSS